MKFTNAILLICFLLETNNRYCFGAKNRTKSDTVSTYNCDLSEETEKHFVKFGENLDKPLRTFYFLEKPQFINDIKNIATIGKTHKNHHDWLNRIVKITKWNFKQASKLSIQYSFVTGSTLKKLEALELKDDSDDSNDSKELFTQLKSQLTKTFSKYNKAAKRFYTKLTNLIYLKLFKNFTVNSEVFRSLPILLKQNVTDEQIQKVKNHLKVNEINMKNYETKIDQSVRLLKTTFECEWSLKRLNHKMLEFGKNQDVESIIKIVRNWINMFDTTDFDDIGLNKIFNEISRDQRSLMSAIIRNLENFSVAKK